MYISKTFIGSLIFIISIIIDSVHYCKFFCREYEESKNGEKTKSILSRTLKIISNIKVFFSPILIAPRIIRAYLLYQYFCGDIKKDVAISLDPLIIMFTGKPIIALSTIISIEAAIILIICVTIYRVLHI